jgi:hypothetical protein
MSSKLSAMCRRSIALLGHISLLSALVACTQPMGAPDFDVPSGGATGVTTPQVATLTTLSVVLSKDSAIIGQSVVATAQGRDQFGRPFAPGVVTWTAVPAEIATVTSDGVVTGIAPGVATIQVSKDALPPGSASIIISR